MFKLPSWRDIETPRKGDEILPWAIEMTARANRRIHGPNVVEAMGDILVKDTPQPPDELIAYASYPVGAQLAYGVTTGTTIPLQSAGDWIYSPSSPDRWFSPGGVTWDDVNNLFQINMPGLYLLAFSATANGYMTIPGSVSSDPGTAINYSVGPTGPSPFSGSGYGFLPALYGSLPVHRTGLNITVPANTIPVTVTAPGPVTLNGYVTAGNYIVGTDINGGNSHYDSMTLLGYAEAHAQTTANNPLTFGLTFTSQLDPNTFGTSGDQIGVTGVMNFFRIGPTPPA